MLTQSCARRPLYCVFSSGLMLLLPTTCLRKQTQTAFFALWLPPPPPPPLNSESQRHRATTTITIMHLPPPAAQRRPLAFVTSPHSQLKAINHNPFQRGPRVVCCRFDSGACSAAASRGAGGANVVREVRATRIKMQCNAAAATTTVGFTAHSSTCTRFALHSHTTTRPSPSTATPRGLENWPLPLPLEPMVRTWAPSLYLSICTR